MFSPTLKTYFAESKHTAMVGSVSVETVETTDADQIIGESLVYEREKENLFERESPDLRELRTLEHISLASLTNLFKLNKSILQFHDRELLPRGARRVPNLRIHEYLSLDSLKKVISIGRTNYLTQIPEWIGYWQGYFSLILRNSSII